MNTRGMYGIQRKDCRNTAHNGATSFFVVGE